MTADAKTNAPNWAAQASEAWDAFWFTPLDADRLARLRIVVGVAMLLYFLSFGVSPARWFGDRGLIPPVAGEELIAERGRSTTGLDPIRLRVSPLRVFGDSKVLAAVHVAAIAGSIALAVGFLTRASAVLVLVAFLSYVNRLPTLTGNFEAILAPLALYVCLGPAGDRRAIDARDRASEPQWTTNVATRLAQLHLVAFLLTCGLNQLAYVPWWSGEGAWRIGLQTETAPLDWSGLRQFPMAANLWSHAITVYLLTGPIALIAWSGAPPARRQALLVWSTATWASVALLSGELHFAGLCAAGTWALFPADRATGLQPVEDG